MSTEGRIAGDKHYARRILDVCEGLHGFATGSASDQPLHEVVEAKEWLEYRLNNWAWGPTRSAFDRLVYRMAEVALAEIDKCFADYARTPLMQGYCDECGVLGCYPLRHERLGNDAQALRFARIVSADPTENGRARLLANWVVAELTKRKHTEGT